MAGHEVGHQELIHIVLLVQGEIFGDKLVVHGISGFAHAAEHRIGHMLRGHFQLAGDVVLHQLPNEGIFFVCQEIVKPDTAADKDLFHPGDLPELSQQGHIVAVVGVYVLAWSGVEALAAAAGTLGHLLFTGRVAEIGGGAAHIVDIALEIRILHHFLRFFQDVFMASDLDDTTLVEGQRAEGAGPEAAPVADQAELDLLNGGHAPQFFIAGVVGSVVGQGIDRVHLFCGQRLLGRILDHVFFAVALCQPLGGEGVAVTVLELEGLGIGPLVLLDLLKRGEQNGWQTLVQRFGLEHCAVDVGDVLNVHSGIQSLRYFHNALFAHAIHEKIRLGVQENGALHGVGPIVIVPQTAEAGLDAADEDGYILVGLADQVAVDNGGVVRPLAHDATGGEGVGLSAVVGNGVVVHHRVHVAAADQKAQPGAAKDVDGLGIFPVRLRDDAHAVAVIFQDPADDGMAEGRVVYIGVTNDIYEIRL